MVVSGGEVVGIGVGVDVGDAIVGVGVEVAVGWSVGVSGGTGFGFPPQRLSATIKITRRTRPAPIATRRGLTTIWAAGRGIGGGAGMRSISGVLTGSSGATGGDSATTTLVAPQCGQAARFPGS